MGGYHDRFSRNSRDDTTSGSASRKPTCLGDPGEYDLRDFVCRRCDWKSSCKLIVDRKDKRQQQRSVIDRTSKRYDPTDDELIEREDSGGVGFLPALAINASLSMASAVADEVSYAFRAIHRIPYDDVIKGFIESSRKEQEEKKNRE